MPNFSFSSLADHFSLACQGLFLLATGKTTRRGFAISFVLCFLLFGTLLNLLSTGLTSFRLLFSGNFAPLVSAFFAVFGVNQAFSDWFLNFLLTLLQSILLSLVIFLFRQQDSSKSVSASSTSASSALESSALVTGLLVLGSGCPTCGTTLLAPLLGTLLSGASSSLAVAGKISLVLNLLAVLLGLLVFRRLGLITYATIKANQPKPKKKKAK